MPGARVAYARHPAEREPAGRECCTDGGEMRAAFAPIKARAAEGTTRHDQYRALP